MFPLHIFGATEVHRGELDKANEDAWLRSEDSLALGDGVTRSRLPDGHYPEKSASFASNAFTLGVLASLKESSLVSDAELRIRTAARIGNEAVLAVNVRFGITSATVDYGVNDYYGTTGLIFLATETEVIIAYNGDPVCIHLPNGGTQALITVDQLHNCHAFTKVHFRAPSSDATAVTQMNAARILYQRKEVRNKSRAVDAQLRKIGFGVFTGEPEALEFVTIVKLPRRSGDRFLLSTDAIRALIDIPAGTTESFVHYADALHAVECCSLDLIPSTLIRNIREAEVRRGLRSDDATVAVVEIP